MSKNISQIYSANPSTSLPGTSLLYAGLSPFGVTNDTAIKVSDFLGQIPGVTWTDVASGSQALSPDNGYITDNGAGLVSYSLPAVAAIGTIIEVAGKSAGGWVINQGAGQIIHMGNIATTSGAGGSLASSNLYDYVKLLCITANTTFLVIGGVGNLTIV